MHNEKLAMPFFTKIILRLLICTGHLSMKISNQSFWQQRKIPSYSAKCLHRWQLKVLTLRGAEHMHFPLPLIKAPVIFTHLKNHALYDLPFLHASCSIKNWNQESLALRAPRQPSVLQTEYIFFSLKTTFFCWFLDVAQWFIHFLAFLYYIYVRKLSVLKRKIACLLWSSTSSACSRKNKCREESGLQL